MQEKTTIKLSSIGTSGIKNRADEPGAILLNELLSNKSRIEDLLVGYYFNTRGRIFDVKIRTPEFSSEKEGSFWVMYSIGHFNACADVDSQEEEKMKITFKLDLETAELILEGEYMPEREPDEF